MLDRYHETMSKKNRASLVTKVLDLMLKMIQN